MTRRRREERRRRANWARTRLALTLLSCSGEAQTAAAATSSGGGGWMYMGGGNMAPAHTLTHTDMRDGCSPMMPAAAADASVLEYRKQREEDILFLGLRVRYIDDRHPFCLYAFGCSVYNRMQWQLEESIRGWVLSFGWIRAVERDKKRRELCVYICICGGQ